MCTTKFTIDTSQVTSNNCRYTKAIYLQLDNDSQALHYNLARNMSTKIIVHNQTCTCMHLDDEFMDPTLEPVDYIIVCVCVCVCVRNNKDKDWQVSLSLSLPFFPLVI